MSTHEPAHTTPGPTRFLVALDASPLAELGCLRALELARAVGAELHVVYVVDGYDPMGKLEYASEMQRVDLSRERAELAARAEALAQRSQLPLDVHPHVLMGPAAKEIVRMANKLEAQLVVVGSHGHGALHRALLGSVAAEVLRMARCSVLVHRPKSWSHAA